MADPYLDRAGHVQSNQSLFRDKYLELVHNITIESSFKGWLHFNITDTALPWVVFPHENLGLYITVTDADGDEVKPRDMGIIGGKSDKHEKQPFLLAFFRIPREVHVRRTRAARNKRNKKKKQLRSSRKRDYDPDEMAFSDQSWSWGRMSCK
jgi:hypothetical protein